MYPLPRRGHTQKNEKMKQKKLFLSIIITLVGTTSYVLASNTHKAPVAEGKKDIVESAYHKAKKEFYNNPEDKTIEEKYITATKALWASQDARAAEMKKTKENASAEQKAHWEAEKQLNIALKEWKKDINSIEKQNAAIAAQKAAFAAQRAASPIFILDNKIVEDINKIDFSKVGKGSYICSEEAVKKFGDKGRNGAIILKYKAPVPSTPGAPRPQGFQPKPQQQAMTPPPSSDRTAFILKRVGATAEQEKKAKKIFEKYNPQIETLRRENNALLRGKDGNYDVNKVLKNNIVIEEKRAEMYNELSEVFSAEQLNKIYRSEMEMARNMVQGHNPQMGNQPFNKPNNPKPTR